MGSQAQKLRKLIDSGEHFFAADCYSVLTGRIVERVGFPAAYCGGHAASGFHLGIPDYGIYSQTEHVELCRRIANSMDIPLIADADTLGDTIVEAHYYTTLYEQSGIAGIHIEDEVNPRHSPHVNGLIPIADMQARIAAAAKARKDPDFVIIARCDEYYWQHYAPASVTRTGNIESAIQRGKAYVEAGADAIMMPLIPAADLAVLAQELNVPQCVIGTSAPNPGTAFTLAAGWGWAAAAQAHTDLARKLFEEGSLRASGTFDGKAELIRQELYDDVIHAWAEKTGRPVW